jgi:hypothetical protein
MSSDSSKDATVRRARRMTAAQLEVLDGAILYETVSAALWRCDENAGLWRHLYSPPLAGRVRDILEEMVRSADTQIAARDAGARAARADGDVLAAARDSSAYLGWKCQVLSFRALAEFRLVGARLALARIYPAGTWYGQAGAAWEANHATLARLADVLLEHWGYLPPEVRDAAEKLTVRHGGGEAPLVDWAQWVLPAVA